MFNRSRSSDQRRIWAGRSPAERSAIGRRIVQTRVRNGTNTRTAEQKKAQSERRKVWVKTLAGRLSYKRIGLKTRGKKHKMTPEGHRRLSESKKGHRNPMACPATRKKAGASIRAHWAAIPEEKRLRSKESKARFAFRQLRKSDPEIYAAEISRRIAKGQRRAWRDEVVRRRRTEALQNSWDGKHHDSRVAKTFTPAYRRNHSRIMKLCAVPHPPSGPRKVWYVGPKGRICMRSSSEVQYAKYLDSRNLVWLYEAVTFKVYGRRYWTPDFYLPVLDEFHEVKGWLLPIAARKMKAVREHLLGGKLRIVRSSEVNSLARRLAA